jgi:hypothetical protein
MSIACSVQEIQTVPVSRRPVLSLSDLADVVLLTPSRDVGTDEPRGSGNAKRSPFPVAIATIPEFLWELSLGIYLVVKGFKPSPIIEAYERDVGRNAVAV